MKKLLFVFSLLCLSNVAQAWKVRTCNGDVMGMRTAKTFVMDRCNIPLFSDREAAILYIAKEWNDIEGVKDLFFFKGGDADCKLEETNNIAFVQPRFLDGAAGQSHYDVKKCGILSGRDGRFFNISIYVSEAAHTIRGGDGRWVHQTVRAILMHEFGHVMGGAHDKQGTPNMLWDPGSTIRTGSITLAGHDTLRNETFLPHDVSLGAYFYSEAGGGQDIAISGQRWSPADNQPRNMNDEAPVTVCPGGRFTADFSHLIKGKNSVSCSDPFDLKFVMSPDQRVEPWDTQVGHWTICGSAGAIYTNTAVLTVPANTSPGIYKIGAFVDPLKKKRETDELNQGVYLGRRINVLPAASILCNFRPLF